MTTFDITLESDAGVLDTVRVEVDISLDSALAKEVARVIQRWNLCHDDSIRITNPEASK